MLLEKEAALNQVSHNSGLIDATPLQKGGGVDFSKL